LAPKGGTNGAERAGSNIDILSYFWTIVQKIFTAVKKKKQKLVGKFLEQKKSS